VKKDISGKNKEAQKEDEKGDLEIRQLQGDGQEEGEVWGGNPVGQGGEV